MSTSSVHGLKEALELEWVAERRLLIVLGGESEFAIESNGELARCISALRIELLVVKPGGLGIELLVRGIERWATRCQPLGIEVLKGLTF